MTTPIDSSASSTKDEEKQSLPNHFHQDQTSDVDHDHALNGDAKPADIEQGEPEKPKGPPPGAFDPRQNPDGGMKAWLCVVGGFCALFCSFGWINCMSLNASSRTPPALTRHTKASVSSRTTTRHISSTNTRLPQ
jgi:hypothetical protein